MSAPRDPADDLLALIAASPSPYHAVAEAARRLAAAGYLPLDEREPWPVAPGLKGYVIRGGGTLVAFEVGGEPPAKAGFVAVAAHTDSPNLRVKPAGDFRAGGGLRQLAVEVYGGVLLSTWLDRDLSLAGRVTLAGGETRLVRFDEPLCRIPHLAIHLDREVNRAGLVLNPQKHLSPLWALGGEGGLRELVAERLGRGGEAASPGDVFAFDLCLYDTQPPARGGEGGAFLFAPRLDNLASCHAALSALLAAPAPAAQTRVLALYDHEEVGSRSAHGADSRFLLSVLARLAEAYPDAGEQALARASARSFLVSADMAHALHPNYPDKHDERHAPLLGGGPVIKINANQSYATDAPGAAAFEALCRASDVAAQRFVSRNDQPCGSTVGPITAAQAAMRAVDVGNPMLSMHSCRETAAAADVAPMVRVLARLFASPPALPPSA